MADLTVSADVDSMLSAANAGAIRTAIGIGTGDLVTFLAGVLSGQSLTGSQATSLMSISTTWNTTGTPTAFLLTVTDTASNANSLLMSLKTSSAERFQFFKNGDLTFGASLPVIRSGSALFIDTTVHFAGTSAASSRVQVASGIALGSSYNLSWSSTTAANGTVDLVLLRDAADTLALRRSTNAQAFNIYNTYTDASNYERGCLKWSSNVFVIGAEKLGTGSNRSIEFATSGANCWRIDTNGNLLSIVNRGYDVGGASNMARNVYSRWNHVQDYVAITSEAGAPAGIANGVRIFCQDDGSGKTQLMAIFGSGAAQQLAIEP